MGWLLGLLPGFVLNLLSTVSGNIATTVLEGYKAKLAAGQEPEKLAADLASQEIAARTAAYQSSLSHAWILFPMWVLSLSVAFLGAKELVWDTALGLGSTPELHGQLASWGDTIIVSMFGYGGVRALVSGFGGK